MFGNNNFNGGYLPDGTYISPGMARMGYYPANGGYGYGNNVPIMNMQNQNMQQRQQSVQMMKGRTVTNIEEVKGILIEPDGSTYYFPCPAENCIYTKTIDLNAQSVINVYKLSNNTLPVYADMQTVQGMENRIANLENILLSNNSQQPKDGANTNDKQQHAKVGSAIVE